MRRLPPKATRTYTLFPSQTRFRSESATFYVREGKQRICVVRVEGPRSIRHHVRVGAGLPLDLGGPGRVILAFSGEAGEPYESIRRAGYMISLGERDPEVSSISAPVYSVNWTLLRSEEHTSELQSLMRNSY